MTGCCALAPALRAAVDLDSSCVRGDRLVPFSTLLSASAFGLVCFSYSEKRRVLLSWNELPRSQPAPVETAGWQEAVGVGAGCTNPSGTLGEMLSIQRPCVRVDIPEQSCFKASLGSSILAADECRADVPCTSAAAQPRCQGGDLLCHAGKAELAHRQALGMTLHWPGCQLWGN